MAPTTRTRSRTIPPDQIVGDEGRDLDLDTANDPIVLPEDGEDTSTQPRSGGVEQESIDAVKEQLEAAERRAAEAEAKANKLQTDSVSDAERLARSNLAAIDNAIQAKEAAKRELQAKYISARETGDYAAETEALDAISEANYQLGRMKEGKNELDRRLEDAKNYAPPDPVAEITARMTPRSRDWVNAHADYARDPNKREQMILAHQDAVRARLIPDSDDYFNFIESQLGLRENDTQNRADEGRQQETRSTVRPPSAPVSRSSYDTGGSSGGQRTDLPEGVTQTAGGYRLSPARREAARISGMTDVEYLKHTLAVHREGLIH